MAQLAKAQSLIRDLKERLQIRFPSYVLDESMDSEGAILLIQKDSSWATTENAAAIRIKPEGTVMKDSIGQSQAVFSPHVAQIVEEESATANIAVNTLPFKAALECEIARLGLRQERYLSAAGTKPVVAEIVFSNLKAVVSDLYHPLSQQ